MVPPSLDAADDPEGDPANKEESSNIPKDFLIGNRSDDKDSSAEEKEGEANGLSCLVSLCGEFNGLDSWTRTWHV